MNTIAAHIKDITAGFHGDTIAKAASWSMVLFLPVMAALFALLFVGA